MSETALNSFAEAQPSKAEQAGLRSIKPGAGGELQLTDAIQSLLSDEQVLAYKYHGTRFDCGSKLGYLKATVKFALRHPEVRRDFAEYLSQSSLEPQ